MGGNGGIAGADATGSIGSAGTAGGGGYGITGSSLTVINGGTISGGLASGGAGVRADAINLTGGTNFLTLTASGFTGVLNGDIGISGSLSIDPGTTVVDVTLNNVIHDGTNGAGSMTKSGAGTLIVTAANTYTGATTITSGVLNIQNATALGTTAGGTIVAAGAALQIQGGITVGAEALTLNGDGVAGTGALRNISGTQRIQWRGHAWFGIAHQFRRGQFEYLRRASAVPART